MKKISLAILVLFLSQSFGQDSLDLESAVSIALQNNYSILIAKNELEITENNTRLGTAGFLPRIDADAAFRKSQTNSDQEYFDGRRIERDNAISENLSAGLSLNWTIFDGLSMFSNLQKLKTLKEAGSARLKYEIETNVSSVIQNYYDLVRLYWRIEVLKRTLAISEERVRIVESKREVGSASKFEYLQARVDLNEDRSAFHSEELRISDAKSSLNILMGRNPAVDFFIKDTIILNEGFKAEDLEELVTERNSELLIAKQNLEVASLDINISNSQWFPRIDVTAGYDYIRSESQSGILKSNRSYGFNYGILAFFNLFNGFNTIVQSQNARILYENSRLQYEEIRDRILSFLFNTYQRYKISIDIIELEKENYQAAEENLSIAVERLRLGSITSLEFREAQIDLLNAQNRLVNAQFEAKTAETELLRLTGQLVKEN